ncbi:amidohydrolase family protein [Planctomicrobium sp. SH527]|uniref:amidohydrolase family protein n=1 Tax=Planctomicrobium sp. SH527 TaxID=3448123 RepID=UPI003F5BB35E
MSRTILKARWLFDGTNPPVEHAEIVIDGDRIGSGPSDDAQAEVIQLGNIAVIPGLINTHTHLEFSKLSIPLEPRREFANWIRTVIAEQRQRNVGPLASVQQGLQETSSTGTSGLAEIATSDWIFDPDLSPSSQSLLVLREFLGLRQEAIDPQLDAARLFLEQASSHSRRTPGGQRLQVGLSPHAPYSLHPKLFEGLCELAADASVPVAMHLAESPAEIELLENGTGPLADLFSSMGIWRDGVIPRQTRPLNYLECLAELPRVIVAHGNLLTSDEMEFMARHSQMSVAYCPRTHAAMQTGEHPWQEMKRLGIRVTLGTDSRASNPDLSLWNELLFLAGRFPEIDASELLRMATADAADALGWEDQGRIEPGLLANLVLISLPESGVNDPQRCLFTGSVQRVMLNGQWC